MFPIYVFLNKFGASIDVVRLVVRKIMIGRLKGRSEMTLCIKERFMKHNTYEDLHYIYCKSIDLGGKIKLDSSLLLGR